LRKLVQARLAQKFSKGRNSVFVRQEISVFVGLVCHASKFHDVKNLLVPARARLPENGGRAHFCAHQNPYEQKDGRQSQKYQKAADNVEKSLKKKSVHNSISAPAQELGL